MILINFEGNWLERVQRSQVNEAGVEIPIKFLNTPLKNLITLNGDFWLKTERGLNKNEKQMVFPEDGNFLKK